MPRLSTLELSSPRSWKKHTGQIIDGFLSERVQALIRKRDPEWIFEDTFNYVIESLEACGEYLALEEINERLDSDFSKVFSHWRGFHACRPRSLDSYREKGILPLTRELLIYEAIAAFGSHVSEERIRSAAMELDLNTRAGNIYLFTDSLSPLDSSCNHYLQSGSEILQGMACHLGVYNRGILASQGSPVLIQCRVPVDRIRKEFREEIYRKLVTRFFQNQMTRGKIRVKILDSCFCTSYPIHPSEIEAFISVDSKSITRGPHFPQLPH